MRKFMPGAGGGGVPTPTSSSSSGQQQSGNETAGGGAGLRYGGRGGDISLGRTQMKDDGADMLSRQGSSPAGFFSNLRVDQGFGGPRAGGSGNAKAHRNTTGSAKMKSQLSFVTAAGGPQGAANLSRISGGAALFPGADAIRAAGQSGGDHAVSRSFSTGGSTSGGFSIMWPWDESRDMIGTLDLGGYEAQVVRR